MKSRKKIKRPRKRRTRRGGVGEVDQNDNEMNSGPDLAPIVPAEYYDFTIIEPSRIFEVSDVPVSKLIEAFDSMFGPNSVYKVVRYGTSKLLTLRDFEPVPEHATPGPDSPHFLFIEFLDKLQPQHVGGRLPVIPLTQSPLGWGFDLPVRITPERFANPPADRIYVRLHRS
jgi:hypothetical protein